jgi:putative tryptophan/tyrosine transport system substrate-binding protein
MCSGTPATKYAKNKIIEAGIPLVFTAVSFPAAAGCRSLTDAGPGFTGATTYMNARDALKITKLAFPAVKILGIVHSDDDAAVTHVGEIKQAAPSLGFTVLDRQVSKNAPIKPAAQELIDKGAQAFVIPLDTYYGMRNNEPGRELNELTKSARIPGISFVYFKMPGAVLYVGSDFGYVGALSGQQAAKIMKEGTRPDTLPIMRQVELTIMVDEDRIKTLGLSIPLEVLQLAKSVK